MITTWDIHVARLVIKYVQMSDAGYYHLKVTTEYGEVITNKVLIEVTEFDMTDPLTEKRLKSIPFIFLLFYSTIIICIIFENNTITNWRLLISRFKI